MRFSNLFSRTLRETPKGGEDIKSHSLMLRAGYIRPLASGIFSYLNFAQKSLRKIEQILREEMNAIGGDEICMPIVHPAEIWQKTNRWYDIDESMVRFKDRGDRDMVLAMTHEEIVATLTASEIDTYKQLPKLVYQIYTKFRDEQRSRGGLIRVREFTMKDSYSLDRTAEGLEQQYIAHYNAYFRIFARTGLPAIAILSDTGMMGGKVAHEYIYVTPIGEDTIFLSDKSGYKANKEVATVRKTYIDREPEPLQKEHTPGKKTIADLAEFLNQGPEHCAKVVFFSGLVGGEKKLVIAVVRGDMEANTVKIQKLGQVDKMQPANEAEITAAGAVAGYASPIGIDRSKCLVIVDELVARTNNLVVGANESDYHYLNACYGRDYTADIVGDIISAYDGALSPVSNDDDDTLRSVRGVEIGNIFQLGTKYTAALNAFFTDEDGTRKPVVMGSYGIGVGRLLSCLCEEYNDDKGLCLPVSVAPYEVHIVGLLDNDEVKEASTKLYEDLKAAGVDVIFDDRDGKSATAGVKFSDADLIGIPIRLTVSKRSLQNGGVEFRLRTEKDSQVVALDQIVDFTRSQVAQLFEKINHGVRNAERWKSE